MAASTSHPAGKAGRPAGRADARGRGLRLAAVLARRRDASLARRAPPALLLTLLLLLPQVFILPLYYAFGIADAASAGPLAVLVAAVAALLMGAAIARLNALREP